MHEPCMAKYTLMVNHLSDTSVQLIKANCDIFCEFIMLKESTANVFSLQAFVTFSKVQRLNHFLRESAELSKKITELSAFYLQSLKLLED